MTTVSTVGYGDFVPKTAATTGFTFVYMIVGIPTIFLLMASLCQSATNKLHNAIEACPLAWLRAACRLTCNCEDPEQKVRLAFNSTTKLSAHRQFVCKQLLPFAMWAYLRFMLVNMFIGYIFMMLQPAWLDFFRDMYQGYGISETETHVIAYFAAVFHCAVTATTVGYNSGPVESPGFQEPGAQGARAFATLHILLSVAFLTDLLERVAALIETHRSDLRAAELLKRQCDPELMATLDRDDDGVCKLEYVTGMLKLLGVVEPDLIEQLERRFEELDTNGDGRLTPEDLAQGAVRMRAMLHQNSTKTGGVAVDWKSMGRTGIASQALPVAGAAERYVAHVRSESQVADGSRLS